MPGFAPRSRRRRAMNEINMVPFIDVMLVLLIIFMVTAPMIQPSRVDLPSVGNSASQLRDAINQAESHIRRLKQQADTVKATESVQRAQTAVAERYQGTDSRLQTALDSLERIKQQQAERSARLEAASEIARDSNGDSLNQRLRQAGILTETQSADSVLARLKARQNSQQAADN